MSKDEETKDIEGSRESREVDVDELMEAIALAQNRTRAEPEEDGRTKATAIPEDSSSSTTAKDEVDTAQTTKAPQHESEEPDEATKQTFLAIAREDEEDAKAKAALKLKRSATRSRQQQATLRGSDMARDYGGDHVTLGAGSMVEAGEKISREEASRRMAAATEGRNVGSVSAVFLPEQVEFPAMPEVIKGHGMQATYPQQSTRRESTEEGQETSATTTSNDNNDDIDTSDHQVALAVARQDLREKNRQQNITQQTVDPQSASAPAPAAVPVGAFRVNPSQSGQFEIQSTAVEDNASDHPNEPTTTPTPTILETNVVLESTLVDEQEEINRSIAEVGTVAVDEECQNPEASSLESGEMVITAQAPTLQDSVGALLKTRPGRWGTFLLVAFLIVFLVLGVTFWARQSMQKDPSLPTVLTQSPSRTPTIAPTFSTQPSTTPSQSPTSAEPTMNPTERPLTLQDLPDSTVALIQTQWNSPQGRAWRWLRGDPTEDRSFDQKLQRFVLATLYYATNGPGWQSQRYWLDHDTSECDWWPHVTGVNWPYMEGPRVCNSQGMYTKLKLAGNGLQGTLPMELSLLLPELQEIDVSRNPELTGEIPEELCNAMMEPEEDAVALEVQMTCRLDLVCECGCRCV